jgi:hypothetical protein
MLKRPYGDPVEPVNSTSGFELIAMSRYSRTAVRVCVLSLPAREFLAAAK